MKKLIKIDTSQFADIRYLAEFIKEHKDDESLTITGLNQNNEFVYVTVNINENDPEDDNVDVATAQANDVVRHNTFYRDGTTEEWFEH